MLNEEEPGRLASEQGPSGALPFIDEPVVDAQALRASALRQARRLVEFYRMTPAELRGESAPAAATAAPATPKATVIKYRHPVTGETWDGEGPHPPWMRQALLHDGYRVDELRTAPNPEDSHARTAA
jgi:DNA-binding protein H-NS